MKLVWLVVLSIDLFGAFFLFMDYGSKVLFDWVSLRVEKCLNSELLFGSDDAFWRGSSIFLMEFEFPPVE